jgi:hypothetical protein
MQADSIGAYPVTWHLVDNAPALAWLTCFAYGAKLLDCQDYCTVVLPRCDYKSELGLAGTLTILGQDEKGIRQGCLSDPNLNPIKDRLAITLPA